MDKKKGKLKEDVSLRALILLSGQGSLFPVDKRAASIFFKEGSGFFASCPLPPGGSKLEEGSCESHHDTDSN